MPAQPGYRLYGGTPADYVGTVVAVAGYTVLAPVTSGAVKPRSSPNGSLITDLLDAAGQPISEVAVTAGSVLGVFQAPADVEVWVPGANGAWLLLTPADIAAAIAEAVADFEVGTGVTSYADLTDVPETFPAAPHTHTLGDVTDTGTRVAMTPTERDKLDGIAALSTRNSSDANLRNRVTHTGVQPSSTITDLTEVVQDILGASLVGSGVTVTYNDAAGTVTLSAAGSTDLEAVRDAVGVALVGVGLVSVTVDDAANTITLATSATQNATDTALRDRSTHTGAQPISSVTSLQATLDGKAASGHTHTASQITDFTEVAQDAVAALLQGASGVTLSYDDAANTLTITGGGAGGLDAEAVRDAIGVALVGAGAIGVVVNDAADTITITTTATVNSTDAQLRDRSTHTGLTPLSGVAAGSTITQPSTDPARATNRTDVTVIAKGGGTPPSWLLAGDLHFASA